MARGTTESTAKTFVSVSNKGGSKGPSNKNVNARRSAQANPAGAIRGLAGKSIAGPDKGAG
jgi:hypothetical protein